MLSTISAVEPVTIVHTRDPSVSVSPDLDLSDEWVDVTRVDAGDEALRVRVALMNSDQASRFFPDSMAAATMATGKIFEIVDACIKGIDGPEDVATKDVGKAKKFVRQMFFNDRVALGGWIIRNSLGDTKDPLSESD